MMNVVNRNKRHIQQAFGNASTHYDDFAHLQRSVAQDLLQKSALTALNGRVLDLGCGTGYLTKQLETIANHANLIALDIALPMLQVARQHLSSSVGYLCADAEALPLCDASIDTVFSNLALQWCQDFPKVLAEFQRVLKPGGGLFFSTFGPQTLIELKQAWAQVDQYRHVNDFISAEHVQFFLNQAGVWQNCRVEQQCYRFDYPSVSALMRELKGLGARHVMQERNTHLTGKQKMQQLIDSYPKTADSDSISASFEVIWVSAARR